MKRKGNTGIWTWIKESTCKLGHSTIIATPEWSKKEYEFHIAEWQALEVIQ